MTADLRTLYEQNKVNFRSSGGSTSRGWLQTDCPYCGPGSGKFHLGASLTKAVYNCWKCGRLPYLKTLHYVTGLGMRECYEFLQLIPKQRHLEREEVFGKLKIPKGIRHLTKSHRNYLKSRGFDWKEIAAVWGVGSLGMEAMPLQHRLYIPIDLYNRQISWTTRSILPDAKLRYISAKPEQEAYPHKRSLYGIDYVTHTVLVVEGPTDVWAVGPGAVGTFGTAYTDEQVARIARVPNRYICADHSARTTTEKLADRLAMFPGETHTVEIDAEDPGSAGPREIKALRKLLKGR